MLLLLQLLLLLLLLLRKKENFGIGPDQQVAQFHLKELTDVHHLWPTAATSAEGSCSDKHEKQQFKSFK